MFLMSDIALFWDSQILFEKFFIEHSFDHQLIHPANMGSPFLPPFKMILIPTGFANPKYSNLLPSLMKNKRRIESFITKGSTLLVFGALTDSHSYDWLPFDLEYIQSYGSAELHEKCQSNASLLASDPVQECDGFFSTTEGESILVNEKEEAVLVTHEFGDGMIVATTIHEFPNPEFIKWVLDNSTSTAF
jgi:hypothetical protein